MALLDFIRSFLALSWGFFTELRVPGLDITFANLFVGIFLAVLGLKFLFAMLGMSIGFDDVYWGFLRKNK